MSERAEYALITWAAEEGQRKGRPVVSVPTRSALMVSDLIRERDEAVAQREDLGVNLRRITACYKATLAGKPVRDADEVIYAAENALAAVKEEA